MSLGRVQKNSELDDFFASNTQWKSELGVVRKILLGCGLVEEQKWRQPCYTYNGKNIAIIGELKDACVLSFFKGVLLKDPNGILQVPGPNTRSGRIMRFTAAKQIVDAKSTIEDFVRQAVELEKKGETVDFSRDREVDIPPELKEMFKQDPGFKNAFDALTPGRRRGYLLYFSSAKQSSTRRARIDKCEKKIRAGKGLNGS